MKDLVGITALLALLLVRAIVFFFFLASNIRERERYVRLRGVPVPEAEKIGRVV